MTHLVRLSKFMALALRHRPAAFGLELDAEGFVPLAALERVIAAQPDLPTGRAEILQVVETLRPNRYEVRGEQIRARYGHAKSARPVAYPPVTPPPVLYHGTYPAALANIHRAGLQAQQRQYVHLSTTLERAQTVGQRRAATPVILTIQAQAAHAAGVEFYAPEAQHYLARSIPPEFILFPE